VPFLDLAGNQALMGDKVKGDVHNAFDKYGLAVDEFNVTSINLPEELQAALDKRISIGMSGDLNKYTQYQVANAIPLAAQNEGGIAGLGAGLSAGAVFGGAMAQGLAGAQTAANAASVAASASAGADASEARLLQLKGLLDKGLISSADYDSAKADVLKKLVG
jgi:membrane protease subunit (stomatin/prohibitin family)